MSDTQIRRQEVWRYDAVYAFAHFFGKRAAEWLFGKRKRRARDELFARLRERPAVVTPIERVRDLSAADFFERYLEPSVPVILEGAAGKWPCRDNWSLEFFGETYGDTGAVVLPEARTTTGFSGTREEESVRAADFATFIGEMGERKGPYIRFSTIIEDRPELAEQLDMDWTRRRFGRLPIGHRIYTFLGGPSSRTRLHCDMPPNLFVQVDGRKHWILYPPEYRVVIDPLLERSALSYTTNLDVREPFVAGDCISHHLDRYEGELEPGDVLFNPAYFWHDVLNLSETVAVSFRWVSPGIHFRAPWVPQLLDLFSTNPPVWRAGLTNRDINQNVLEAKIAAKKDPDYVG